MPLTSGVVFLQRVDKEKRQLARSLRKSPTPAEKKLWALLRENKILGVKFRRQQVIEGFIADFFCHKAKLVIEVDGGIHDTSEQKQHDLLRRDVFKARGLLELRFRNEEVLKDAEKVVGVITEMVEKRIWEP